MGNEMGNNNVSGLKEEENTAVEGQDDSTQEANHVDHLPGDDQIQADEDTRFYGKVEGSSSKDPLGAGDPHVDNQTSDGIEKDETQLKPSFQSTEELPIVSNDAASQETGIPSSPKHEKHNLDKEIESNLEEILLVTSGHQIEQQASTGREPLEAVSPESNNQDEHDKFHAEKQKEGDEGWSPSCQAKEKGNLLETEAAQNVDETVVSDATKLDEEITNDDSLRKEIASQENLADTRISDDKREIATTDKMENGLDNKCSEEAPTEMNLSSYGSSKPAQEAISLTNSSNSFEEVPTELNSSRNGSSKSAQEAIPKIKPSNSFEKIPIDTNLSMNGSSKSPQEAISLGNSSNTIEYIPETLDKCIVFTEDVPVISSIPETETKNEVNASQLELMLAGSGSDREKESLVDSSPNCVIDKESLSNEEKLAEASYQIDTCYATMEEENRHSEELIEQNLAIGTVPTDLIVTAHYHEAETEEEKAENFTTEEPMPQSYWANSTNTWSTYQNQESCSEFIPTKASSIDPGSIGENPSADAELRKSLSFDFDLSLEARSEESDQTPLLHPNKTQKTRSLSTLDGSVNYQAISVEEKTIKMERSDSDKQRAPFLTFLKEEEKPRFMIKSQEQDGHVIVEREVELKKRREKRKPRGSLFTTCICCAAAIN